MGNLMSWESFGNFSPPPMVLQPIKPPPQDLSDTQPQLPVDFNSSTPGDSGAGAAASLIAAAQAAASAASTAQAQRNIQTEADMLAAQQILLQQPSTDADAKRDADAKKARDDAANAANAGAELTVDQLKNRPINYDPKGAIKNQYDNLKTKLRNISNQQNDDIEVARWNTYYYKKAKMESNVFIYIISVCVLINILTFLHKTNPYFDSSAYSIIVGTILAISLLVLIHLYYKIYSKDSMNFDEIDYGGYTSRIHTGSQPTEYVDVSMNNPNCSLTNRDPKNIANSNFLKQLF
jgi:hypothetical protein